ncbi:MAG: holo-[acyl-carrier-protein] synthase [Chloroflexi bacterium]|nr:holo-[acyl-carrier-protein] synthase [Chloroflexota bacterium]
MTLRIGFDLVDVPRFRAFLTRRGGRALTRLFTPHERAVAQGRAERLAARFAAKEAVAKALGTGLGAVGWLEIEVRTGPHGAPQVHLSGRAAARARALGLFAWSISLTHTDQCAGAVVIGWGLVTSNTTTETFASISRDLDHD